MSDQPKLGAAFQSLFLILASDLLLGVWFAFNREQAVQFFLSQVPLIGAAGVCWSFFPKATKEAFGEWLEWILGSRVVRIVLSLGLLGVIAITFVRVSSTVSLTGNTGTWLYLVPDSAETPSATYVLDSARLNGLTSPVTLSRWATPGGLNAWICTPTMISRFALPMRFWRPASAVFPEDFDSLAAVVALPGGSAEGNQCAARDREAVHQSIGA